MIQNPNSKVFFLGIGAQKSGTSWLSTYFTTHPEILMSPIKEMCFFCNRKAPNLKRFERQLAFQDVKTAFTGRENKNRVNLLNSRISVQGDIEHYKRFFRDLVKTEKAYGEISPSYAFMDKSEFVEIHKNFPECRIIFLLRNPVDRVWSQMRFSHTKDTPSELLENALCRIFEPAYALRSDYRLTIERLISVFPRDQIHFEFFEHLFTQNAVDTLCDFLGVCHKKATISQKRNAAFHAELPPKLRREMARILKPQYDFANAFFNSNIPSNWGDDLKSII